MFPEKNVKVICNRHPFRVTLHVTVSRFFHCLGRFMRTIEALCVNCWTPAPLLLGATRVEPRAPGAAIPFPRPSPSPPLDLNSAAPRHRDGAGRCRLGSRRRRDAASARAGCRASCQPGPLRPCAGLLPTASAHAQRQPLPTDPDSPLPPTSSALVLKPCENHFPPCSSSALVGEGDGLGESHAHSHRADGASVVVLFPSPQS